MQIERIYNNNVVLATRDDGSEVVLVGRSLGFNQKVGDQVDVRLVEQTFLPETADGLVAVGDLLAELPLAHVRAAVQVVELAKRRVHLEARQSLLLAIVDHLGFAIQRAEQGVTIDFPLKWEVANLYPVELQLGREAVALINDSLGVQLDPGEAVAFALHFVNATFASDNLSPTVQMTATISDLFKFFEEATGAVVNRESMSAARFVTHLRYLFIRLSDKSQINTTPQDLVKDIESVYGEAFALANKMRYRIEMSQGAQLTEDEVAYLALHVARLSEDQCRADARVCAETTVEG